MATHWDHDYPDMADDAIEAETRKREASWRRGWHETRTGKRLKLREMSDNHLKNTIRFFTGLDTKPLKKELKKRSELKM